MKRQRRKRVYCSLLIVGCLLAGCGQGMDKSEVPVDQQTTEIVLEQEGRLERTQEKLAAMTDEELDQQSQISVQDFLGLKKVTELPEKDCYLYWDGNEKVAILRFRGERFCMEEFIFDSHFILPDLYCGDYDGDGEDEVALSLHTGHGTGVSVDTLCVIDRVEGELQYFFCQQSDLLEQVTERVLDKWYPETRELYVEIDKKMQNYVWNLDTILTEIKGDAEDEVSFIEVMYGDQISFVQEDGRLWMDLQGGYRFTEGLFPWYENDSPHLRAEVLYQNGSYELGEILLNQPEVDERYSWTAEQWEAYRLELTEAYLETVTEEDLAQLETAHPLEISVAMDENALESRLWLLAEVPEKDCAMYYYAGEAHIGVLRYQDQWLICRDRDVLLEPWRTMPELYCWDYDGDGAEEVVVLSSTIWGTGTSIREMAVVEESPDGLTIQRHKNLNEEIEERVTWDWNPKTTELRIFVDGKLLDEVWNLAWHVEAAEGDFRKLDFSLQVDYEVKEERIWVWLEGGYLVSTVGLPWGDEESPVIRAEVLYEEGEFRLGDIRIQKKSEWE